MLIFSGDITDEIAQTEEFQEQMKRFSERNGIHLFPSFPHHEKISLTTPSILEADVRIQFSAYNYDYLPDRDVMNALLYPIFISHWLTSPTHYTKRSGWKNYELIYTHSGSGILNMENNVYYLSPDTLCLLDCQPFHYYFATDDGGWEYSFIHFSGPSADFLYRKIAENGIVFSNLKNTNLKQTYDAIPALAKKNPPDFDLRFHLLLTSLLVDMACAHPAKPEAVIPEWLSLIQSYIIENYNKNWNIKDLARRSCLSESRFSHVFKEIMGFSPVEYRDYLRIEHAKEFLRDTALSIEQIAEETGFASIPGFYSAFSRRTGLTPGKYRKQTFTPDSRSSDSPHTDC